MERTPTVTLFIIFATIFAKCDSNLKCYECVEHLGHPLYKNCSTPLTHNVSSDLLCTTNSSCHAAIFHRAEKIMFTLLSCNATFHVTFLPRDYYNNTDNPISENATLSMFYYQCKDDFCSSNVTSLYEIYRQKEKNNSSRLHLTRITSTIVFLTMLTSLLSLQNV